MFASQHIDTLSANESNKIWELAKLTDNNQIKKEINIIVLENFQKQVGKYLLDVQALNKNVSWRDSSSDSIYQAVKTIMWHYDGSQPSYSDMVGRYQPDWDKQNEFIQNRQKTYQEMEVFQPWSTQPCVWANCATNSTDQTGITWWANQKNKWWDNATEMSHQTEILIFDEHVKKITSLDRQGGLNKLINANPQATIIAYMHNTDCQNCAKYVNNFNTYVEEYYKKNPDAKDIIFVEFNYSQVIKDQDDTIASTIDQLYKWITYPNIFRIQNNTIIQDDMYHINRIWSGNKVLCDNKASTWYQLIEFPKMMEKLCWNTK